jgi:hypothetical protein
MRRAGRVVLLLAALCVALTARAHDSWLAAPGDTAEGPLLELGTGTRFPVRQFSQSRESVIDAQCIDGSGMAVPLSAGVQHAQWLDLDMEGAQAKPPLSCHAELAPAQIELDARTVQIYFAEIHPTTQVRQAWSALQLRGIRWHERYRKFARIELASAANAMGAERKMARRPLGSGLEIVAMGDEPITTTATIDFQVLRDGTPLAGQAVELVSERSAFGVWQVTDTEGRLRHRLPFNGRWLLRTVDLRPPADDQQTWESRFATLAFEAP